MGDGILLTRKKSSVGSVIRRVTRFGDSPSADHVFTVGADSASDTSPPTRKPKERQVVFVERVQASAKERHDAVGSSGRGSDHPNGGSSIEENAAGCSTNVELAIERPPR